MSAPSRNTSRDWPGLLVLAVNIVAVVIVIACVVLTLAGGAQ